MTNTNNENIKQYFTQREALEMVWGTIENGFEGAIGDLHHETFNTDYYIVGTHEAKKALEQYGVFKAIGEIQEYEKFNFGEMYTDLGNPVQVANMLMYIVGQEAMQAVKSIDKHWDKDLEFEEVDNEIKQEIGEVISQL